MNRILKTFLLWLLMAALPVQGMAAVIKASCGPRHHDLAPVMLTVAGHHHLADAAPHRHDIAETAEAPISSATADPGTDAAATAENFHNTSYCSACATCCTGTAALPSSASLSPASGNAEAGVMHPVISFTGFIPAGPERPPRHLSA